MMGVTHYRLGAIYYVLLSMLLVSLGTVIMPNVDKRITILGIIVAAFGGLMPDADSQHSKINKMNPLLHVSSGFIEFMEKLIKNVLKIALTIGLGSLILFYSNRLILELNKITIYSKAIVYIFAGILIVTGILSNNFIKHVPALGSIYKMLMTSIEKFSNIIKRSLMIFMYSGFGVAIIIYNKLAHKEDVYLYFIAVLFIFIGIFPHRTFLHSLEGLVLSTFAFWYVTKIFGYSNLTWAFFIGYASHLYLADIFTNQGVPLSIIPNILKFLKLEKIAGISLIYKILKIKLKIPLMSTGTTVGNIVEFGYVILVLIITIAIYVFSNVKIYLF